MSVIEPTLRDALCKLLQPQKTYFMMRTEKTTYLSCLARSLTMMGMIWVAFGAASQKQIYAGNREPLHQVPFVSLPLGAVKAEGWLLKQLHLQRDGLTGFAEILYDSKDDLGSECDWLGGSGDSWERAPYYVKGLVALAYTLRDEPLMAKAVKWVNWSLQSQQPNGFFGPPNNTDWWARMPMLYAIRDYYEATGDARVIPFFTSYFRY